MRRIPFPVFVGALGLIGSGWMLPASVAAEPLILYVATDGRDDWSGRQAAPNRAGTDGPLASVDGAKAAIRRLRQAPGDGGPVEVQVRGGRYWLERPLVFEPADSGTAEASVTYAAYRNERPVFSGGRRIEGFRVVGSVWECEVSAAKAGQWCFQQLFVNGARRPRAREPDDGYYRVAGLLRGPRDPRGNETARDRFVFQAGELAPWARLGDAVVVLMHSWETSMHPIRSVDTASNVVEFVAPLKEWWPIGYWEAAQRYYVENALELLDSPGEWYLDRETGRLTYWPLPGEQPDAVEVVAPFLTELVRFAGDPDTGRFVDHVTLRGLTFQHADWVRNPKGNSSTQAAVNVPAAIMADAARHCAIEGCEVSSVGLYAIWFSRGCQDCRIVQNRLHDLGAGGIRLGHSTMPVTDAAESTRNLIDNNHIYDGGRVWPGGVGVWVAQSSHNRISHNDIHDLYYTGLSIGWTWNDATNRCHDNLIEFNHVHHLGHEVLSDAGLIYCLGRSPGSVIRNNLLHDIWPYREPAFGWGIYLDALCSGYVVESNVVYNTRSGGIMFNNGGAGHRIENNVFARSADYAIWPYFAKAPNTFRRNLVYLTQGELFIPFGDASLRERLAANEPRGTWDENLYWHTGGADRLRFMRRSLAAWQALGFDRRSVVADPRFRDVDNGDFRLRARSPALRVGFRPFELQSAGLHGDPAWVREARGRRHARTALPVAAAPLAPFHLDEGFESTAVGERPAGVVVAGEERGASMRVTREQAASGQASLKVLDTSERRPAWQPHFYYQPRLTEGLVRQRFKLWLAPDARGYTEWRDLGTYPRNVGPSFGFDPGGQLLAAGRPLTKVPTGQWIELEIASRLGEGATRTYTATVTVQGRAPEVFRDLPWVGKEFTELHWLGFVSAAATNTAYYLDDLVVGTDAVGPVR